MTTGWASFGLHPVLMTLAFGLFMPLSALSYRGLERLLGVSHAAAKATHGTLMLVALILGVLGVIDMWLVHEDGAAAQAATRASPGPRRRLRPASLHGV